MDLSPPSLTRSPASPSITYCPSERSSLDYPSPDLVVEQQYRLASIYGDQACSLNAHMDGESLHSDWNTTALHASSASPIPSILSSDYDSFGSYPYSHDVYQTPHSSQHTPSLHAATPPPTSTSRSPIPSSRLSFASNVGSGLPGVLTPRIKMESEYGQHAELSHYPSPRSVHTSYPSDAGGAYAGTSGGYLSDDGSSGWHEQDNSHFYPGASSSSSSAAAAFLQQQDSSRRSYQHPQSRIAPPPQHQRPRRAPRRLTTKEEANFQCEVKGCGKLFSRSYNFKAHMETHDEKREYPFPCTMGDCAKKFVRKTDLQRHHQSVHMRERNHKCDFCSRLFARKDTLRRHMEDGCSKRFDIASLDLRQDGPSSTGGYDAPRPMSGPIGHFVSGPPPPALPPMAIPPLSPGAGGGSGSFLGSMPLRGRSHGHHLMASDAGHHGWGR